MARNKKHTVKALVNRLDPISTGVLIGKTPLEPYIDMGQPDAPHPPCAACGKTPEPFWVPCPECGAQMYSSCQRSIQICPSCRAATIHVDTPTLQTPMEPNDPAPLEAGIPVGHDGSRCKSCGRQLEQTGGHHRKREFCDDACKQTAYRKRQQAKLREQALADLREQFGETLQESTLDLLKSVLEATNAELAQRLAAAIHEAQSRGKDIEQELERYRALLDLSSICPWTPLAAVQEYLREHSEEAIPFTRKGKTIRIIAIDNHARAVSDHQGLIRLNDDEIEQCRVYVLRKLGQPVTIRRVEQNDEPQEEETEQRELQQQGQRRIRELEREREHDEARKPV